MVIGSFILAHKPMAWLNMWVQSLTWVRQRKFEILFLHMKVMELTQLILLEYPSLRRTQRNHYHPYLFKGRMQNQSFILRIIFFENILFWLISVKNLIKWSTQFHELNTWPTFFEWIKIHIFLRWISEVFKV